MDGWRKSEEKRGRKIKVLEHSHDGRIRWCPTEKITVWTVLACLGRLSRMWAEERTGRWDGDHAWWVRVKCVRVKTRHRKSKKLGSLRVIRAPCVKWYNRPPLGSKASPSHQFYVHRAGLWCGAQTQWHMLKCWYCAACVCVRVCVLCMHSCRPNSERWACVQWEAVTMSKHTHAVTHFIPDGFQTEAETSTTVESPQTHTHTYKATCYWPSGNRPCLCLSQFQQQFSPPSISIPQSLSVCFFVSLPGRTAWGNGCCVFSCRPKHRKSNLIRLARM